MDLEVNFNSFRRLLGNQVTEAGHCMVLRSEVRKQVQELLKAKIYVRLRK